MTRGLPLLGALIAAGGCFRYEPLVGRPPSTGEMVRIHLTNAGASGLGTVLGPQVQTIDGMLIGAPDSAYLVAVSAVARDGAPIEWSGDTVSFRRDLVASIEHRMLDVRRSALAVGGAAVAVVLSARIARNGGAGTPGSDAGGGNPSP